jgi:hypothetical protein
MRAIACHHRLSTAFVLCVVLVFAPGLGARASAAPVGAARAAALVGPPLAFVPNVGQRDAEVLFEARGARATFLFTREEVVLALGHGGSAPLLDAEERKERAERPDSTLRIRFEGANSQPEVDAEDVLDGSVNYLVGDCSIWRTDLPTYGRVVYRDLSKIDAAGRSRLFSTYLGGPDQDTALAIAVDGNANVYVAGATSGGSFPTVNPHQEPGGDSDAVILKIAQPEVRRQFHRADPNGSGTTDLSDGVFIFGFLFIGGPASTCRESADANNSGAVDISDGIFVLNFLFINFLFIGGPPPSPPGPATNPCGVDPDPPGSAGDIGCEIYPPCA